MTQKQAFPFLFLLTMVLGFRASAMISENSRIWQKSVPFFRTQNSPFSSGEATLRDLEKRTINSEWDLRFDVSWDGKNYLLDDSQLALDINFATRGTVSKEFRFQGKQVQKNAKVKILKVDGLWCHIQTQNEKMWVPTQFVQVSNEDLGVYRTIRTTKLRQNPDSFSKSLADVPASSEFLITQWKNDWLQVRWQNRTGYIHSQDLLGRSDFAQWAFVQGRGWVKIKFRVGSELLTDKQEHISLSTVKGYKPFTKRAFIINKTSGTPPLKSIVEIKARRTDRWNLSLHENHGPVWWKTARNSVETDEDLSFDELIKRNIFSFDSQVSPKTQGLISADGIYHSKDGKAWRKIAMFGEQNYPVALYGNTMYVGSYRSDDGGKSFEPYIRWEMLYSTLQKTLHRQPPLLRLVDIRPRKGGIDIRVDTGIRRVKLTAIADSQTWNILN